MTVVLALQLLLLLVLCFTPVWLGGQAMTCYNEGKIFRSALCAGGGTLVTFTLILLIVYANHLGL